MMTKYFFDLYFNSTLTIDHIGTEHSDPLAARQEAIKILCEVIGLGPTIEDDRILDIGVRDERGRVVAHGSLTLQMRAI